MPWGAKHVAGIQRSLLIEMLLTLLASGTVHYMVNAISGAGDCWRGAFLPSHLFFSHELS